LHAAARLEHGVRNSARRTEERQPTWWAR
jgi:hypothetical protein